MMHRHVTSLAIAAVLFILAVVPGVHTSACVASPLPSSFTWLTPPEVVDTGVTATPYAGGTPLIRTSGTCAIVYAKQGDIYLAFRDANGWQPPLRVTNDPADSRDPQLVLLGSTWHVFWEDDRSGHPEAMTRRWNGTSWSAEEVLGPDDSPTRTPSAAAFGTNQVIVVCQEGPDPNTVITARVWSGGVWGNPETVSPGSARAQEPTVASRLYPWVAWSDTRHGPPEIYLRRRQYNGTWGAETRLTNMNGNCRRPSIHIEECCGDYINDALLVAFENDQRGVSEVWAVHWWLNDSPEAPVRISTADTTPSRVPNVGGFAFLYDWALGGYYDQNLITWTDGTTPGAYTHRFGFFPPDQDALTSAGLSGSLAAACPGRPWALLAFAWAEPGEELPALVVRQARVRGCTDPRFITPYTLLLGPEGYPANEVQALDDCPTTMPVPDRRVTLILWGDLDPYLTWDATQPHPQSQTVETGEDGWAYLGIRGGGCRTSGQTSVVVNGIEVGHPTGARSPDVNGDCAVRADDLAYFRSKLGTNDFCADLVADGIVDAQDIAIVEAAMGDLCSQLVSVGDGTPAAITGLSVIPNPCRETVTLLFTAPAAGAVEVTIADASGRIVRRLDATGAAGIVTVTWDTRDAGGRTVASGVYFARVRCGGHEIQRTVMVMR